MEQYKLNTVQNISIDRAMASVAERIVATLIDLAIVGIYYLVLIYALDITDRTKIMVFSIPPMLYHLVFELVMNGQSPGKKILKIKVFSENGGEVSFVNYFIRWIFRLIDVTFLFGSIATLLIITTKKNQRIGDIVGNTIVLNIKEKKKSSSVFIDLPNDYEIVFPEVEFLDMKDIQIVNEVIDFLKRSYYSEESRAYAGKTKEKIALKLQINSKMDSVKFLYTVLKDYNFIHQKANDKTNS